MARRRSAPNYKQIVTGTKDMGDTGSQIHIAKIEKLDEQLKGCFLNNVLVSCQTQVTTDQATLSAFTVYLSTAPSGSWSDDKVITARSTPGGGGTVNLVAKRRILTNETSADVQPIGPVHVWAEVTDIPQADNSARFTIEAWGRMHNLLGDGL